MRAPSTTCSIDRATVVMEAVQVPTGKPTHERLKDARFHVDPRTREPYLRLEKTQDGILVVTMGRVKAKNGFDDWMYLCVADALDYAEHDESVLVVVLTGNEGNYFSSGADLQGEMSGGESLKLGNGMIYDPVGVFMRTMLRFPKPLVAAVSGPAIGVGCTMLAHCDVLYAVDDAFVWTPFSRIAVVPEFCSSVLFPKAMGPSIANEMLLFSKQIPTLKLGQVGFFSGVYPRVGFLKRVLEEVRQGLVYPLLSKTLPQFKRMIKIHDIDFLERVCCYELKELDGRAERGEVAEAVVAFMQSEAEKKMKAAKM